MALDPIARAFVDELNARFPPVETLGSIEDARAATKPPPGLPVEPVSRVEELTIPGTHPLKVRCYFPADDGRVRPGIVYYHGGGWVLCDLDTHDAACRRLANATDSVVVAVDYRRAPEHPFPAAADDAWTAFAWTAGHHDELRIDPTALGVAGDSAGGNLAAVTALAARDDPTLSVAVQLLVYPVIDSSSQRAQHQSRVDNASGYRLHTTSMEWFRAQYLAREEDGDHPRVSPNLAASLVGAAPACIVTAEFDPLRDEGEAYGRALARAGVPVTLFRAPGMFHGFFNLERILPGASRAQEIAFRSTRAWLAATSPREPADQRASP